MKIAVYGAGGHASVVLDCLLGTGANIACLIDDVNAGHSLFGIPVVGDRSRLPELLKAGVTHVHVAIGDNAFRIDAAKHCQGLGFQLLSIVHPTALVGRDANIGPGCFIAAQAIVGPRARVGECCILNHACSVDHDCVLDDAVHVAPGARLAGHVRIGRQSMLGLGSVVRDRVNIGSRTTVGAGSVVVSHLPDDTLAYGSPAKARSGKPAGGSA